MREENALLKRRVKETTGKQLNCNTVSYTERLNTLSSGVSAWGLVN